MPPSCWISDCPTRTALPCSITCGDGATSRRFSSCRARSGLDDRVSGLHKGASDYMVKPFATDELVARLQALLRRPPNGEGHKLALGNVTFESENRQTAVAGKMLALPAREADVLEVLLKRGGRLVSHEALEGQVFGQSQGVSSNAIEVYIHRLRRLLADAGSNVQIHTIRGAGYLMDVEKEPSASPPGL